MSLDTRINNPSLMHLQKSKLLLQEVSHRISSGKDQKALDALASLQKSFSKFYLELGDPAFKGYKLNKDDLIDPDEFSRQLRLIQSDLDSLYQDAGNMSSSLVDAFNLNESLVMGTEAELKKASSLAQDTQMITGIGDNLVFTAGDDFNTLTKSALGEVDGTPLFVDVDQGALILPRTSSENVGPKVQSINVLSSGATIYEGNYYDFDGNEVPEGGSFRLTSARRLGFNRTPQDGAVFDGPRSVQDLMAARLNMVDDNVDTYWLAEVVQSVEAPIPSHTEITGTDSTGKTFIKQVNNTVNLDDQTQVFMLTAFNGDLDAGSLDSVSALENLNDIDQISSKALDNLRGLQVTTVLELSLKSPTTLNWINLVPIYNHPSAFISVNTVQLGVRQDDGSVLYTDLPGIKDGRYETVLTPEANEELTEKERLAVLSPNRFGFGGQGLWTFAATENVVGIKISLSQSTPIPAPYHALRFEMERVVTQTTTVTTKKKVVGQTVKKKTTTSTATTNITRLVELDRTNTLKVTLSGRSEDKLAGVTAGESEVNSRVKLDSLSGFLEKGGLSGILTDKLIKQGVIGGTLAELASGVFKSIGKALSGLFGSSKKTTVDTVDSGWQIKDQYLVPKYDKVKWQLGVRELGLFRNLYSASGEFRSTRFKSPEQILKVTLRADEWVPEELRNVDATRDWIKYEISLDDETWHQIAPEADGPAHKLDSRAEVPQVYNINSELSGDAQDPRQGYITVEGRPENIRLRVHMTGSSTNNSISPVLKGYRLNLLTKKTYE